jgi:class 3 adenylate cyclase
MTDLAPPANGSIFGSSERMDYTIIGNTVNLTAPLQSNADIDGIMLGHETYFPGQGRGRR